MNKTMLGAGALCAMTLAACSTVTRGTTNQLQILSEPAGATARTSLNHSCTTPCTLTVGRKDEFAVTFNLPGYKEQIVDVKTRLAGAGVAGFVGNVVVGGVVGMGVDAITGSTLEHFPSPIEVRLEKDTPPAPPPRRNRR
jgi:hypothetical protein